MKRPASSADYRRRKSCPGWRRRRSSIQSLETRRLLAVDFQFNYLGGNNIGFNDPTTGADFRAALELAGNRLGDDLLGDATINIDVGSLADGGGTLAQSQSVLASPSSAGSFREGLVSRKIRGFDDLNGGDADASIDVFFADGGSDLPYEVNPDDVSATEVDFVGVMYQELVHLLGWQTAITVDGDDNNGDGINTPGNWRVFDRFVSDSSGNPLISDVDGVVDAFEIDLGRFNAASVGGPGGDGGGLFFVGPMATTVHGGPVPLFTPDPFVPDQSVVHLDSDSSATAAAEFELSRFLMAAGTDPGPRPQELTLLEKAVLSDLGILVAEEVPPVLTLPGTTLFVEGNTTGGFTGTGDGVAEYLASVSVVDQVDPSPSLLIDAPELLAVGQNDIPVLATDASGNQASGIIRIVVDDSVAPTIIATPDMVTFEATSPSGITGVDLGVSVSAVDIVDASPVISGGGTAFPLGTSTATFTARDFRGNQSTADVTVTVVDTTAPQSSLPAAINIPADRPDGARVDSASLQSTLAAGFSDLVDTDLEISLDVDSLVIGTQTVTVTATDDAGNRVSAMTDITVDDTRLFVTTLDDELDADPGSDPNDLSLREAISLADAADGSDVIVFDDSLSGEILLSPLLGPLIINSDMIVDGGDADTIAISGGDLFNVVFISEDADELELSSLTIRDGLTTLEFGFGAGVRYDGTGELRIIDSVVSGNRTTGQGGAGAGVQSTSGNVTLLRSVVNNNRTEGAFASGGGVWTGGGTLTISDSTITGNSTNNAYASGGGVYALNGPAKIFRSTISDNTTNGNRSGGAGVSILSDSASIEQSTITGNQTDGPDSPGAGVRVLRGHLEMINSTVSANFATESEGGGVTLDESSFDIRFSTIVDNDAFTVGGGLYVLENDGPAVPQQTFNVSHTVIANNIDDDTNPDVFSTDESLIDVSFSLIGDNTGTMLVESQNSDPTTGNLIGSADGDGVIDPGLGPLSDNGGPTLTHRPAEDSPLVDAGDPSLDPSNEIPPIDTDQRGEGFARVFGFVADIGAVERNADVVVIWEPIEPIVFPTPLSGIQLDATANVPGSFTYTPPAGILVQAGADQTLRAVFTPEDPNLDPVLVTNTITVLPGDPTLSFDPPAVVADGTELTEALVAASASVTGSFTFDPPLGTVLTVGAAQTITATFTPNNTNNFNTVTGEFSITVIGPRDYGDAPAPYATTLQSDGPRHGADPSFDTTIRLGSELDTELSPNADEGDDGVAFPTPMIVGSGTNRVGIDVTTAAGGFLNAWIDFNDDGQFGSDEQIADGVQTIAGRNTLIVDVPSVAAVGQTVFGRFRISSDQDLDPTGPAIDGEVEDWPITLQAAGDAGLAVAVESGTFEINVVDGRLQLLRDGGLILDLAADDVSADAAVSINGGDGNTTLVVGSEVLTVASSVNIDLGSGRDTVQMVGGEVFDLTDGSLNIANVRVIDLSAAGGQTLILDNDAIDRASPSLQTLELVLGENDVLDLKDREGWQITNPDPTAVADPIATSPDAARTIEASVDSVWQNFVRPSDVDNNGTVNPVDALRIINELRRRDLLVEGSDQLIDPGQSDLSEMRYLDQNGDGRLQPIDALRIINEIRRLGLSGEQVVEGEPAAIFDTIADPDTRRHAAFADEADWMPQLF